VDFDVLAVPLTSIRRLRTGIAVVCAVVHGQLLGRMNGTRAADLTHAIPSLQPFRALGSRWWGDALESGWGYLLVPQWRGRHRHRPQANPPRIVAIPASLKYYFIMSTSHFESPASSRLLP